MLKFVLCIMALWFALALVPDGRVSANARDIEQETIYPSHTCPDNHSWYLVDSDPDSVTVACYSSESN